ncbi:MAG: hypothetical protein Q9195_004264 [Heterodermia aff. obscurata]
MSAPGDLGGPHLDVPSTEDLMRLSPDTDRHGSANDDIDIDFEFEDEIIHEGEDANMDEQPDSMVDHRPADDKRDTAVNDDEMVDESETDQAHQEQLSLLDEDLEDADGLGMDDDFEKAHLDQHSLVYETEQIDEHDVDLEDTAQLNGDPLPGSRDEAQGLSFDPAEPAHEQSPGPRSEGVNTTSLQGNGDYGDSRKLPAQQLSGKRESETQAESSGQEASIHQEDAGHLTVNTEGSGSHQVDYLGSIQVGSEDDNQDHESNEDDGQYAVPPIAQPLHPIVVVYQGNEMSLFPPVDQDTEQSQTYFLSNESYASESLTALFGRCKAVLADSIREDEELEIRIADLGLALNETSAEYTTTTLSQILDLFVQLSHNDGSETPGPLYLELYTNYKVLHRLDYLMNAVVDGKGLSQLEFLNESEDISGGNEYAQEDEIVAKDGLDETNSATNLENEHSFSIDNEKLPNTSNSIGQAETTSLEEGSSERTNDADANHTASTAAHRPFKAETQVSHSTSTQEEHSSPAVPDENHILSPIHAVLDDDDIIDYSDEEAAPERSAGSSTIKGDGLKGDNSDSMPVDKALEDTTGYDGGEELGKYPTDSTANSPSHAQVLATDTDEIIDTLDDEHESYELNPIDFVETEDFEEIIGDDAAQIQDVLNPGPFLNGRRHGPSKDDLASEDVADKANHDPPKSVANTHLDNDADHQNNSDNIFEDDLGYVSEDTITHDPGVDPHQTAGNVDRHELVSDDIDSRIDGARSDMPSQHSYKAQEADKESLVEDIDQITYEDDDEITISDQLDLPKPTSGPPALKRYREDETLANGTSTG